MQHGNRLAHRRRFFATLRMTWFKGFVRLVGECSTPKLDASGNFAACRPSDRFAEWYMVCLTVLPRSGYTQVAPGCGAPCAATRGPETPMDNPGRG